VTGILTQHGNFYLEVLSVRLYDGNYYVFAHYYIPPLTDEELVDAPIEPREMMKGWPYPLIKVEHNYGFKSWTEGVWARLQPVTDDVKAKLMMLYKDVMPFCDDS